MIENKMYSLVQGDCLSAMRGIEDESVNLIITDLPYGVTNRGSEAGKWDNIIPFDLMWEQFLRITKRNAAIVLFAQGMFTANLMLSQPKLWRYNLIWDKCRPSGFLNANRMQLRRHEDICVFYREQPCYNPQYTICDKAHRTHSRGNLNRKTVNTCYGQRREVQTSNSNQKHPTSILAFPKPPPSKVVHPTQKPVELLRYLIRTYSNEGYIVMDATMGSGSTGVAAVLEGRKFIGIEQSEKYFAISKKRIEDAEQTPRQYEFAFC